MLLPVGKERREPEVNSGDFCANGLSFLEHHIKARQDTRKLI